MAGERDGQGLLTEQQLRTVTSAIFTQPAGEMVSIDGGRIRKL